MIIGYGKLGRSWNLDPVKWSTDGGDADVWRTLWQLATRNPQHTFLLIGRNTCDKPQDVGFPSNVVNPWIERQPLVRARFNENGINHPNLEYEERKVAARILYDHSVDQFLSCDQMIWWAGQHGTSGVPLVFVGEHLNSTKLTKPQDSTIYYTSYAVHGINAWRNQDPMNREEIWLCPDVRNYLKARDIRWPLRNSVIAQFNQTRQAKHERFIYDDPWLPSWKRWVKRVEVGHVWVSDIKYTYDALEGTALAHPPRVALDIDSDRKPFGMIVNENRKEVSKNRLECMKTWVLPNFPDAEIWGKWSPKSQEALGRTIDVCPYDQLYETLGRYRSSLTTPASGSGWATSKPWECFLAGAICFFHPEYDTQGHIVPTARMLRSVPDSDRKVLFSWLRPKTPEDLKKAVDAVSSSYDTWKFLALEQRKYVEEFYGEMQAINTIESRLGVQ